MCAGDDELAPFLPLIDDCRVVEKAKLKFYTGKLGGVDVAALFSGVCKVNAAIAAQILIETFGVDVILNAGVAGGMAPALGLLDTVISTEVAYHDVAADILTEFHPWMPSVFFPADARLIALSKAAAAKLNLPHSICWGRMVTGETFIDETGRQAINDQFAPLCVDMETAGVAHVCYVFDIPFLAIRSITDTAAHTGLAHFEENCKAASAVARDVTVALIGELSLAPWFSQKRQPTGNATS